MAELYEECLNTFIGSLPYSFVYYDFQVFVFLGIKSCLNKERSLEKSIDI